MFLFGIGPFTHIRAHTNTHTHLHPPHTPTSTSTHTHRTPTSAARHFFAFSNLQAVGCRMLCEGQWGGSTTTSAAARTQLHVGSPPVAWLPFCIPFARTEAMRQDGSSNEMHHPGWGKHMSSHTLQPGDGAVPVFGASPPSASHPLGNGLPALACDDESVGPLVARARALPLAVHAPGGAGGAAARGRTAHGVVHRVHGHAAHLQRGGKSPR